MQICSGGLVRFKVAVDGDCIAHVAGQIESFPSHITDLIVSVGGNDARSHSGLLSQVQQPGNLNGLLVQPLAGFRLAYQHMLDALLETQLQVSVCTIYTAVPFSDPVWRQYVPVAIEMFNKVIVEEAKLRGLYVCRLETLCIEPEDFSEMSPIEPSSRGGQKIVDHIIAHIIQT